MNVNLNVKEKIKQLLGEITGNPELAETLDGSTDIINDIGLDSIQMINFVLIIEDEFLIQLDFENFDFENLNSIDILAEYITGAQKCSEVS